MQQRNIGDGTVSVSYEGLERDSDCRGYRRRYRYIISANGWRYIGNDLSSGVSADINERDMLASLLGFMSAFAESRAYASRYGYGENINMFPSYVGEWVDTVADDIALAEYELSDPDPKGKGTLSAGY